MHKLPRRCVVGYPLQRVQGVARSNRCCRAVRSRAGSREAPRAADSDIKPIRGHGIPTVTGREVEERIPKKVSVSLCNPPARTTPDSRRCDSSKCRPATLLRALSRRGRCRLRRLPVRTSRSPRWPTLRSRTREVDAVNVKPRSPTHTFARRGFTRHEDEDVSPRPPRDKAVQARRRWRPSLAGARALAPTSRGSRGAGATGALALTRAERSRDARRSATRPCSRCALRLAPRIGRDSRR